jgi:hypothetical protein
MGWEVMTKIILLDRLAEFTAEHTKDIILPVRRQKDDYADPEPRAAAVYKMRLIKEEAAQKAAPYIIHQIITGKDAKPEGERQNGCVVVRSIFCVYSDDAQEGSLLLLNLMERLRIAVLKQIVLGKQFQLSLHGDDGLDTLIYPDDTAPYFAGEMMSTWLLPSVEREV